MSISNRCFPTKAINIWLETGEGGRSPRGFIRHTVVWVAPSTLLPPLHLVCVSHTRTVCPFTGDAGRIFLVGSYFHYSGGFEPPEAKDISPNPGRSVLSWFTQ
jgi:hypothetical protein